MSPDIAAMAASAAAASAVAAQDAAPFPVWLNVGLAIFYIGLLIAMVREMFR